MNWIISVTTLPGFPPSLEESFYYFLLNGVQKYPKESFLLFRDGYSEDTLHCVGHRAICCLISFSEVSVSDLLSSRDLGCICHASAGCLSATAVLAVLESMRQLISAYAANPMLLQIAGFTAGYRAAVLSSP